jgi:DNA-binding XRE family transcriptional regulator
MHHSFGLRKEDLSRSRTDDPCLPSIEGGVAGGVWRVQRVARCGLLRDPDDSPVSISHGPNAAQDLSGADLHHSIARLLKERREERGLSRRELGRRVDLSHSLISLIERGQHAENLKTLKMIAAALDMRLLLRFEHRANSD